MFPSPLLVFDIETIPDLEAGKRLHGLDLPDDQAMLALSNLRRQDLGHEFPRLPFHEIVCISGLWVTDGQLKLFSFSQAEYSERELIQRFLNIFEQHFPTLISWNGSGFDLPVLMYRAMKHGLTAKSLLDQTRHTDLMDVLAMFNGKNFQKLDDVANRFRPNN